MQIFFFLSSLFQFLFINFVEHKKLLKISENDQSCFTIATKKIFSPDQKRPLQLTFLTINISFCLFVDGLKSEFKSPAW